MYRVRAEAVSGTKVFADGKWLTCIGNKPVHVGDRIWTDGRCVYGNYQTPQTPMIVYEEGTIPILIYDKQADDATADYYSCTLDMELEQLINKETSEHFFLINDRNGNIYIGKRHKGYRNSEDWQAYGNEYRLDVNIDEQSNLYELVTWGRVLAPDHTLWGMADIITILENGAEVLEIDLTDMAQAVKNEAESLLNEPELSVALPQTFPVWGVIEDKTSWAIIIGAYCSALVNVTELNPYNGAVVQKHWEASAVQNWYLYTPNGQQQLYHSEINSHGVQISSTTGRNNRLPIQDGYYFTIKSFENGQNPIHSIGTDEAGYTYLYPTYMNVSICSPEEAELISGKFIMGTYFTIYEGELLGINTRGGRGTRWEDFPYADLKKRVEDSDFTDGLYLINAEDKTLEPIISGVVRNWKFRPIEVGSQITDWEELIPLEQIYESSEP